MGAKGDGGNGDAQKWHEDRSSSIFQYSTKRFSLLRSPFHVRPDTPPPISSGLRGPAKPGVLPTNYEWCEVYGKTTYGMRAPPRCQWSNN